MVYKDIDHPFRLTGHYIFTRGNIIQITHSKYIEWKLTLPPQKKHINIHKVQLNFYMFTNIHSQICNFGKNKRKM